MATSSNTVGSSVNQRRRAIHAALAARLGGDTAAIRACFHAYEREFAGQPYFLAPRYVARCAEIVGLDDTARSALTRAIFENLARPYEMLPRYPAELLEASRDAAPPRSVARSSPQNIATPAKTRGDAVPMGDAAHVVFAAVARSLLMPVRTHWRSNGALLRTVIEESIGAARVDGALREAVLRWAISESTEEPLIRDADLASLRRIVNGLYLAACDALGPVAADRLLSQAIMRAQALPEAVEFAPDQLL
jgi:hypothetical protein